MAIFSCPSNVQGGDPSLVVSEGPSWIGTMHVCGMFVHLGDSLWRSEENLEISNCAFKI